MCLDKCEIYTRAVKTKEYMHKLQFAYNDTIILFSYQSCYIHLTRFIVLMILFSGY